MMNKNGCFIKVHIDGTNTNAIKVNNIRKPPRGAKPE